MKDEFGRCGEGRWSLVLRYCQIIYCQIFLEVGTAEKYEKPEVIWATPSRIQSIVRVQSFHAK